MIGFYVVVISSLLLLQTIANTLYPNVGAWFGEQGLSGYIWFFTSITIYIILATWSIIRSILLIKKVLTKKLVGGR